jgi:hypothetical protein
MNVSIYIQGKQLDLFKDENIEINLSVKNISDISKVVTDFTQGFTIPASPTNNQILTYWFDADVDGTFNGNLRVDAYLEVNSLPYKSGVIQLDNCKLKKGLPYSYSITFFSNAVSLTDRFADNMLSGNIDPLMNLNLTDYNHNYNAATVTDAMHKDTLSGGDVYYPLISATGDLNYGDNSTRDIIYASNTLKFTDFKPAIRLIRIIEALEVVYGITFSRDFFDRALFYNLFMWLHKDSANVDNGGQSLLIDFTSAGNITDLTGCLMNLETNQFTQGTSTNSSIFTTITPSAGYETVPYGVERFLDGESWGTRTGLIGTTTTKWKTDKDEKKHTWRILSTEEFKFTTILTVKTLTLFGFPEVTKTATFSEQTVLGDLVLADNLPQIKVKDFINSLIAQFNLIIKPTSATSFYVDTLDNWYSKGKTYDITGLVDIKEITVAKPDIKKQIDFTYQKTDAIIGKQYFDTYQIGYGDLRAKYEVSGSDLKIESQFENMMFELLVNPTTKTPTNIQCGLSVDKELAPYKSKPFIFYKNGRLDLATSLKVSGVSVPKLTHTATEDNLDFNQVTNSLNFGDENSTYFYTPISKGLYYNFWKTYIEDLFNRKCRVLTFKCKIPVGILYNLGLNDRFIIGDKKYKISTAKVNLINADATIEVFTDFSAPVDSASVISFVTVDSGVVTVDSPMTVDGVISTAPTTSYITNGISATEYLSTRAKEHFEIGIKANTGWIITTASAWITINKMAGKQSDYVRISTAENVTGANRTGTVVFTIGVTAYTLTVTQLL